MKLYNYLNRKLESFVPIHRDYVGLYVCGPTVYGDPHLGHARSALTFDILYRYLLHKQYKVRYVRNITDVGSLEDETHESSEDKIEKIATLQQKNPMEIAQFYTNQYHKYMDMLNILSPSIEPLASGHIIEQQQFIKSLIERGWGYEVNGSVYFDVKKFATQHKIYGTLSGKKIEDLLSGQRELKNQDEKRNVIDFALWKEVADTQVMHWPSTWSTKGVPGWHTECCVLSKKYLGLPFDIHGGGIDLQFPHHEAEIAQSVAETGQVPANYWLYNNMITIDHKKMSKSLGNFITLEMFFDGTHERLSRAYSPQEIRFFVLRSHYRSIVDFSDEVLNGTAKGFQKLQETASIARQLLQDHSITTDLYFDKELEADFSDGDSEAFQFYQECLQCLDNDLDTPSTIALLFRYADTVKTLCQKSTEKEALAFAYYYYGVFHNILGLEDSSINNGNGSLAATQSNATQDLTAMLVSMILEQRKTARLNKDYTLSDKLRDSLLEIGITIKDNPDGSTHWSITGV